MQKSIAVFDPEEIIEACLSARARGGSLSDVFSIDDSARRGPSGTKYFSLRCTTPNKSGRLHLRFKKEKHAGTIAPIDDAEVARINEAYAAEYGPIKRRDRNPSIAIRKFPDEDDENCPPSPFYEAVSLLDEFFAGEMDARLNDGRIVLATSSGKGPRDPRSVAIPNARVASLLQTFVSSGEELTNPICRVNMKFGRDTGLPKNLQIFDYSKPFINGVGGRSFEPYFHDGRPPTAHNIHLIVKSRTIVSGIVRLDAVCASNMGLSIPSEVQALIVQQPAPPSFDIEAWANEVLGLETPATPEAAV